MSEIQKYMEAERMALIILPQGKDTHHPDPLAVVCLTQLLLNWKKHPWSKLKKIIAK